MNRGMQEIKFEWQINLLDLLELYHSLHGEVDRGTAVG